MYTMMLIYKSVPCSDGDWDFYWCDREWLHANYDTTFLQEHQKILHFRNHYEVIVTCQYYTVVFHLIETLISVAHELDPISHWNPTTYILLDIFTPPPCWCHIDLPLYRFL